MKIIFWDYDGTLVDTEIWYKKSIINYLKEKSILLKNISNDYFFKNISGKHPEYFIEKLKQDGYIAKNSIIDSNEVKKYYTDFFKNLKVGDIKVIDNIDKIIEKLSQEDDIIMCITSSSFIHDFEIKSHSANSKILNKLFKIGENIYLCGNIENCKFKPAPDVYLYALNDIKNKYNLHLTKNDKLFVVEDSNAGCAAATSFRNQIKDLDIKVVRFISNPLINTTDDEKTDFIAKTSAELYEILKN